MTKYAIGPYIVCYYQPVVLSQCINTQCIKYLQETTQPYCHQCGRSVDQTSIAPIVPTDRLKKLRPPDYTYEDKKIHIYSHYPSITEIELGALHMQIFADDATELLEFIKRYCSDDISELRRIYDYVEVKYGVVIYE